MPRIILLSVFALFFTLPVSAQQNAEPCGPAMDLSEDFSKNVDAGSRCFELRMYTAEPAVEGEGGIDNLHQRFREEEVAIFEKHGAEVVAVWQRLDNPNTLVWMLAYRDRAHRQEVWEAFAADPAWQALREKYAVPLSIEAYMMSATDYSKLK
ncbi:MAG: NIPSNAP family protein [Pseudomonadota bacterium]|nr:NIPSNAP family protein [Pseudomonadota bacterium]